MAEFQVNMDPTQFALATERLLNTVQKLSLARNLETITTIVRTAATTNFNYRR